MYLERMVEGLKENQNQGALREEILASISKGTRILGAWESYNATQKMPSRNLKAHAAVQAIKSGLEEYRRHYIQQDWTLRNGFAQSVAEAVRKIPQAVSLLLCEGDADNDKSLVKNSGKILDVRQAIFEVGHRPIHWLIRPITWDTINDRPRESLPTDLLWQIPIELYKAGVQLVQLGISLEPGFGMPSEEIYDAWDFNDEITAQLKAAAKCLERFEYQGPSEQPRHIHTSFMKYMCAMVSGPWLKHLDVWFLLYEIRDHQFVVHSSIPIRSLLSAITAPDLVCKILGGFFRNTEDVETTLPDCPSHLVLEEPHLREGRWADALDILRSRSWDHLELVDPTGGECENMDIEKYSDIFEPLEVNSSGGLNKASLYICRDESQMLNPLRIVPDEQEESVSSSSDTSS